VETIRKDLEINVGWLPNDGSVLFTYNQLFLAVCIPFFPLLDLCCRITLIVSVVSFG